MQNCVLIAGLPASGKTTFADHLCSELGLPMVSKDRIKEMMYDTVGFRSRDEKVTLSIASTNILYYFAESLMRSGQDLILENNFENVVKPKLQQLLQQYGYKTLTIRFGGELETIYRRYLQREQSAGRHPGHKTNLSFPESDKDAQVIKAPLSEEEFRQGVEKRGIRDFSVGGEEIHVDTTSFEAVSYPDLVDRVRQFLGGHLYMQG